MSLVRHTKDRDLGGIFGTQTRYLRYEELIRQFTPTYTGYRDSPLNDVYDVDSNQADIDKACDAYLDAAGAYYNQTAPRIRKYIGLIRTELDGAIQQVVLSIGRGPAYTIVARNDEHLQATVPYERRRQLEQQLDFAELDKGIKAMFAAPATFAARVS